MITALVCAIFAAACGTSLSGEPLSVQQALKRFRLDRNLRIECVASEPLVVDPVAIRFDEHGRMWVVEMRDYPLGPPEGKPYLSRIRILTDTDGDGKFDKGVTFADQLPFCTGVQPWRGGAIVTLAGEVAYFADEDQDGRADRRETWYRGFTIENPQLRANHPRLGWDHHVYIANGLRGGTVVDARKENAQPVSISGRDFRFDPLSGAYEAISGVGQFGLTFNNAGERFVCSNRNPLRHIVLENRYLAKAPQVVIANVVHDVAAWGFDSRVFPLTKAWTTSNLHAGQFTAACGVLVYRDQLLGDEYRANGFTCEPTGSLVHREIIRERGATYAAEPAYRKREFLASTDDWFRPVNLVEGPLGELYVVDMYRAVIEHPQFMPTELKQRPDLRWGDDRGRIYRITPRQVNVDASSRPRFDTSQQCAKLLGHETAWVRETAARLLLEQAEAPLTKLLEDALQEESPHARIHALWLLDARGELTNDLVQRCLKDSDWRVRRQAIIVAENRLDQWPAVRQAVEHLGNDQHPKVRFQVALSLAGRKDISAKLAASIANASLADGWTWSAVRLMAATVPDQTLLEFLAIAPAELPRTARAQVRLLAADAGRNSDVADLEQSAPAALTHRTLLTRLSVAAGLLDGLRRRRMSWKPFSSSPSWQRSWQAIFTESRRLTQHAAADDRFDATTQLAIELLAEDPSAEAILLQATAAELQPPLRQAAINSLVRIGSLNAWKALLERYPHEPPAVRRQILDGLLAKRERVDLLLDALEANTIRFSELDRVRANRLLQHRDGQVKARAAKLAAKTKPTDRQQLIAQYAAVVQKGGDPLRGRVIFEKQCATCHQVAGIGVQVAPDISDSRVKTPLQFLTDILAPNQAIDNNYVSYSVRTLDGRVYSGILATETATSVTLKQPEGKTIVLPRSEIEALRSDGISLMPEDLNKNISPAEMADLIAFLKNWRYLDGRIPGQNQAR